MLPVPNLIPYRPFLEVRAPVLTNGGAMLGCAPSASKEAGPRTSNRGRLGTWTNQSRALRIKQHLRTKLAITRLRGQSRNLHLNIYPGGRQDSVGLIQASCRGVFRSRASGCGPLWICSRVLRNPEDYTAREDVTPLKDRIGSNLRALPPDRGPRDHGAGVLDAPQLSCFHCNTSLPSRSGRTACFRGARG